MMRLRAWRIEPSTRHCRTTSSSAVSSPRNSRVLPSTGIRGASTSSAAGVGRGGALKAGGPLGGRSGKLLRSVLEFEKTIGYPLPATAGSLLGALARRRATRLDARHLLLHVDAAVEVGAFYDAHVRRRDIAAQARGLLDHHRLLGLEIPGQGSFDHDHLGTHVGGDGALGADRDAL